MLALLCCFKVCAILTAKYTPMVWKFQFDLIKTITKNHISALNM